MNSGSGFSLTRSYVYGSYVDDVIAKFENDTKFLHKDRQFSVRGLSNGSAAITKFYVYSVYGKQTILNSSGNVITQSNNKYGFTGRYIDEETGLWYFRARYFSDEMGRFISRDPLGYVDGLLRISTSPFSDFLS